jgi:cytoskeletal protein CcmA (bactofilin family)
MARDSERAGLSCISRVIRVSGDVEFRGLAKIEGHAEGEIMGDDIEIAPSAVVSARITANSIRVGGQISGDIVAHDRVELLATARVQCTMTTPTLVVAEGAQFDGDCKMPDESPSSPQSESNKMKGTRVSFVITEAQRAELHEARFWRASSR